MPSGARISRFCKIGAGLQMGRETVWMPWGTWMIKDLVLAR